MKIDLTETTSSRINSALIEGRRAIGAPTIGMVLTLVIVTDEGSAYDAMRAATDASREHPSRILAVIKRPGRSARDRARTRLDAEVLVGSDAGAGEQVILRLHGELVNHAESVVLPLLPLMVGGGLLLAPLAAALIQMAVSRSRESQADESGARLSHDPLALASALGKLDSASKRIPAPATVGPAEAHLFIVNPLRARRDSMGFTGLFLTHPPTAKRIERLEQMAANPR